MSEKIIKTLEFGGIIMDDKGKYHHVRRVYCEDCGVLRAETHHGCCGYMSNGWASFEPCECKSKKKETI